LRFLKGWRFDFASQLRNVTSSPVPFHISTISAYNSLMQKKMFWLIFTALGLIADLVLPFWWAVGATIPILALSWWIAFRSDWF
jgi:hypothetical protein